MLQRHHSVATALQYVYPQQTTMIIAALTLLSACYPPVVVSWFRRIWGQEAQETQEAQKAQETQEAQDP